MRRKRCWWLALAALCAGLAPGTWLRTHVGAPEAIREIAIKRIADAAGSGELALAGAWQLAGPSRDFGGFSALLARPDGGLVAFSDRGFALVMDDPHAADRGRIAASFTSVGRREARKIDADIEAATQAPGGMPIWVAYEASNAIARLDRGFGVAAKVAPQAMQRWNINSGAEAMARLTDGRFIVLSEGRYLPAQSRSVGLLFAEDPLAGGEPVEFTFLPPEGFRPSDMATLPDGRVLVLLRAIDRVVPPLFATRIVIADPQAIRAGEEWAWEWLPPLPPEAPRENYEGLAIRPRGAGAHTLWLVSDDNTAALQRTILMELVWRPGGPADAVP